MAENEENWLQWLDIFEGDSRKKVLELYNQRTEVIVISQNKECPQIKIFISGNKLKQTNHLKYLGSLESSDRCNTTEIASRITQAKRSSENEINTYK